ncbi:saccharopine dehydrogenase [Planomonospora sp. ID67723]|uniref:NAD-dependent epimerase/dehydratase family protein n=1 Tax=Planomonospora sp. ID67723 TaxID=2738134 RepID=UPI0018C398B1|nr:NAD-dependent epimerase/dehydratase family protein [Planomonospora sp. ID67723]MBG0831892.1 saccharopine dehydrogenase [Planomonospora sp. ID67723]
MKVLVLGGYGAVGARIVTELRAGGAAALAAGRDSRRADVTVDLREPRTLHAALEGVDAVVNAAGAEDPALVETVTGRGVAFVDITATAGYVTAVERLTPPAPVLLSVGLAPGLTNLLAVAVHEVSPAEPIDIALLLGAGERHGGASTAWAYDLLGRDFHDPATGAAIRNYTRPRRFVLPGYGPRRLYRTDYSDQHVLTRDLGVPVRTHFGLDSRAATAALAALTRVPGASRVPRGLHPPGSDRWLALARSGDGTVRWLGGRIQSQATAVMAALATRAAAGLPAGVHHLHRVLTLADVDDLRPAFSPAA